MGELMDYLNERKNRLLQQKNQYQNFDINAINQKINKINTMIQKLIDNPSWDV